VTVPLEQRADPGLVANVEVLGLEAVEVLIELRADVRGRGLGAEEVRPHVVLDADDVESLLREKARGL
jgi:hypothetical protein